MLGNVAAKAHFAAMLEDALAVQLPRVKPVSKARSGPGRSHNFLAVDAFTPLSGRLIRLAQQLGTPLQSVLLSAHFKVLSAVSGQNQAVSCVTHNGRPERGGRAEPGYVPEFGADEPGGGAREPGGD